MITTCKFCQNKGEQLIQFGFSPDGWQTATIICLCSECFKRISNIWGLDILTGMDKIMLGNPPDLNIRMIEAMGASGELG